MSSLDITERDRIRVRPVHQPINRTLFAAGLSIWAAWQIYEGAGSDPWLLGLAVALAVYGSAWTVKGARMLYRDYRLRRAVAIAEAVGVDHGSARQSTPQEREARGLDDPSNGELFGLDEDGYPVWRPANAPFGLFEMPPGVGKTVCFVMGSILHRAMLGYSVVVPDIKTDLAVMLARSLRYRGFDVWCINPAGLFSDIIGNIELNPYQALVNAVYGDDRQRKDAVKLAADYAALQIPLGRDEKNPYFVQGSRRAHAQGNLTNALLDPMSCSPTDLYALLADPSALLRQCIAMREFQSIHKGDRIVETARLEARNLLHRARKNEENFAAFLEGASQRMMSFNPAGHLGYYGRGAVHDIKAIRERQLIVFIVTPLSHLREFGDFISLLNHNIIAACKAKPDGHPVHIVGEEALNYRFQDLVSDLETLRQLRVTGDFYIQSFVGLERQIGREAAAAVEAYADVRVFAGLNSFARATHVSDMLAQATIGRQEASFDAVVDRIGLANRELGRRQMTPDEILAMGHDQAWLFVRGMRPTRLRMIHYAQVAPWTDWVDPSPITNTRLQGRPVFSIDYGQVRKVV